MAEAVLFMYLVVSNLQERQGEAMEIKPGMGTFGTSWVAQLFWRVGAGSGEWH